VRLSFTAASHICQLFDLETDVADERDKFIEDAKRLAEDVSSNRTFNTVQPLLNFWAAFSPSKEVRSGQMITMPMVLSNTNCPSTEWDWDRRCS